MTRLPSPFEYLSFGFEVARLGVETQSVIALRTLGMAGLWNTPFDENYRMVAEKHGAFLRSGGQAIEAVMAGRNPVTVARAAMVPLDEAASDNRQRLHERGPRKTVL